MSALLLFSPFTDLALELALLTLLVGLSALFSAAEASLISTPAYYRRHLVDQGDRTGATTERLGAPNRVFVTVLVGNYLVNVAAAAVVVHLVLTWLSGPIPVLLIAAIGLATVLLLTLGELVPRAMATVSPDKTARRVTGGLVFVQGLLAPVIWLFERFSALALKLSGAPTQRRVFLDEEELKHMVEMGQEQGIIEEQEKEMISAVIEFADISAREVMVPRTDIVALEEGSSLDDVVDTVTESGYSRIPVYRDDLDHVVGFVYGKDVLPALQNGGKRQVTDVLKEGLFVPETATLDEVLREMKTRRIHIAIVHDEFGGTAGLVTLEDILEEIVGDIFDEYDPEAESLQWLTDHEVRLDARMTVEEVNEALGTNLPEDQGYETVGGFLFHELGRPGRAGEVLTTDGVEFTLEEVDKRRIIQVKAVLPVEVDEEWD